jgi:hypothetical protein
VSLRSQAASKRAVQSRYRILLSIAEGFPK